MSLTKLDAYDYVVLPGVIRIRVGATNDPDILDILSEISRCSGKVYVEGCYYLYLDTYRVFSDNTGTYFELDVVQTA